MRKFFNALSLLILAIVFCTPLVHADTTGYNNGTALGRGEEINYAYGLQASKAGEKFTVGLFGSANGYVSQVSSTAALPLGFAAVGIPLTNSVGAVYTLANGTPGQIESFVGFGQVGSDSAVITPATATGFTTATLAHTGATVMLEFINSTVGWFPLSYDNNTLT